eukprot:4923629-Pleurochrysis_carterae.AAC.1
MTPRTVGVSDSMPFQSAAMQGRIGDLGKNLKTIQEQNKMQNGETRMDCMRKPNERFRNNSVVKCEDTTVSHSSRPRSPSGGWRLDTTYHGYF